MWELLDVKIARVHELDQLLADPAVLSDGQLYQRYAKERASLGSFVGIHARVAPVRRGIEEAEAIISQPAADPELTKLADHELKILTPQLEALRRELEELLLEDNPDAHRNVVIEIRAGTGGLEASLFAADLYRMYTRYAAAQGWAVELLSSSTSEAGGFKEVIFGMSGTAAGRTASIGTT